MRVIDLDYNVLLINDSMATMLKKDKDELIGKKCYEIFPGSTCNTPNCPLKRIIKYGEKFEIDTEKLLSDGKHVSCILSVAPFTGNDGKTIGILEDFKDITDRKKYEALSFKNQKLEAIGTLAGGIAHDFNNILMGILGNISLAKLQLPKEHPILHYLEKSEQSMSRAKQLTGQLLTFATGGGPIKSTISIRELIEDVVNFDLSGSNVKLVFEHSEDLWTANVDKGQIQQVFSNLAINARQAMPEGGVLYITLENVNIAENTLLGLNQGTYIKSKIRDVGIGIDKKHIERIFDPFFSTKETGRGLGLATVYSIIKKHDGYINLDSELGKGTTFTIYLPASKT